MQVESSQNELPKRFDEAESEQSHERKSTKRWTDVDRSADFRLQQVLYKRSDRVRRVEGRASLQDLALDESGLGRSGQGRSASGRLAPVQSTNPRRAAKQPEPMTQSLVLLASMALVLVAARFAVPRIVEEIRYGCH